MKKSVLFLILLVGSWICLESVANSAERKLSGPEISSVLTGKNTESVGSDKITTQAYYKSGETIYTANGSASQGNWDVRGDQYCSQWPPNDAWACYDVVEDGGIYAFVSNGGKRYPVKITGDINAQ